MKYILVRIAIILLLVVAAYHVSDCIQESVRVQDSTYNFDGVIAFFRMLVAIIVLSMAVFIGEAYAFGKQKKIKERNLSLFLITAILLLVLFFSGYFFQFAL